ncbi:citramalyl-CoA lyase, mitochondrial isoform X5 [Artibeus jamaicensis]|uniref:citramalyl-CoA lyase, mitochondrial isoform X5 n=1 Tax=Artibeus jamaicensis TaxID=9417 RepID=UPI00235A59ED|nr:citramalyl-CoA lyase, mitochondrial isoform X5 [Artibeus jamaicensis]XP_053519498.1 citramalyl-CoA lyase, mitochondrial isoform X5 [Artibeus jamaicensis]
MAQEQLRAPEPINLSDEEIASLSDAQFKTLVIRILTELVDFSHKLEKHMEAKLIEMNGNTKETNSKGKEIGTQIDGVDQKEEKNDQTEKNEETRIQKNEESLRNLQDIFKRSNIQIIGVPEGEESRVETLFEQIIKENFPILAEEIDFQEIQEGQRVPKKLDPRRNTPRHIIIALAKIKMKERILEAARAKGTVTYKGVPIRLSADFSKETLQARRGWKEVFQVMKTKDLQPRLLYPAKLSFRMEGQIKCFLDKTKFKEFIITKPLLYEMLKGLT